jgi:alcohol dehydrogenase (cytochrome c)
MVAAVTATAGDVLFTGEVSGDFLVLNAKNGKVLYRFYTGGSVAGGVISYAIDSKQYVAAMSGGMTNFWQRPGGSATVFVFAVP